VGFALLKRNSCCLDPTCTLLEKLMKRLASANPRKGKENQLLQIEVNLAHAIFPCSYHMFR
jgi:hypothetical protein